MKRIEFIAPVEAMRGNLSGNQKLQYAENNNPAYDSPVGSRNYARNYSARFIGAKIASSGKKYFAVKTKSAVGLTQASKKAMAVMGAAGAIFAEILRGKDGTYNNLYAGLQTSYSLMTQIGEFAGTFRQYVMNKLMDGLRTFDDTIEFKRGMLGSVILVNPWSGTTPAEGWYTVSVSQTILIKFWGELAANGITFKVQNVGTGISFDGLAFDEIIPNESINILGLTKTSIEVQGSDEDFVTIGEAYLKLNGVYVKYADVIVSGAIYTTTAVLPA